MYIYILSHLRAENIYYKIIFFLGEEETVRHVSHEPSGKRFNAFVLDNHNLPHNPMVNAGARYPSLQENFL